MEPLWAHSARRDASIGSCRWLALGLLAAVGCNSGRQLQTDLYQRELRLQEDEIYRLEDCIEEYQAIVRDYRCELAELKKAGQAATPAATPTPAVEPLPEPEGPAATDMLPDVPEPLDLGPPASAGEVMPDLDEAPTFDATDEAPPFEGAQLGTDETEEPVANAVEASDDSILVAASANRATGGGGLVVPPNPYPNTVAAVPLATPSIPLSETIQLGVRSAPDQTLIVRIAERSAAILSDFDGVASVMLTDPSIDGQLRRIARWDFTAGEVREAFVFADASQAELVLQIALPATTPTDQPLRLWVRLIDAAGNKTLQATAVRFLDRPLRLANPTELATAPRRLPATDTSPQRLTRSEPIVVTAAQDVPLEDTWRTAQETRPRRIDPAIQTASFEAAAE